MIEYNVYRGVYPFDELLGVVDAPEDQPEQALSLAIGLFFEEDMHPVVAPA